MTFSIVAWDPEGPEWGVAVASKFLAAGAVVPWARAGAGALATQAFANVAYGPDGLAYLATGRTGADVVATLTAVDPDRDQRQLGVVDRAGRGASFTGSRCLPWAGDRSGDGFAAQGNVLLGPGVLDAMVEAFLGVAGDLPGRLLAALAAGDAAGGDRRGRQSAALLVVRAGGGYLAGGDVAVDLRVDDHVRPVEELGRLLEIHRLLFPRPEELEFLAIDAALAAELRARLRRLGRDPGAGDGWDADLAAALAAWVGEENLEARWRDGAEVERGVLAMLRRRSG